VPFFIVKLCPEKNGITTKDRTLAAIILWIKELPKCLYQKGADFLLTSRDLLEYLRQD
jgi:hypothetical protein